jgi:hypothetical protein
VLPCFRAGGLWQVLPWAALAPAPGICGNSGLLAGFIARQEATAAITRHFLVPEGLRGSVAVLQGSPFPFRMGFGKWLPVLWRAVYFRRCRLDDTD